MLRCFVTIILAIGWLSPVYAQSAEEFYRNNRITILVASEEGGSLSTYARMVAQHMPKYLPDGAPAIIVQHMPGAGGVVATANFANNSPTDGTVLLLPVRDVTFVQTIDAAPKFDAGSFNWIGRMVGYPAVIMVAARTGVETLEDAKDTEVIVAATSALAQASIAVNLVNHLFGTKFKNQLGYRGGPEMFLAIERGEADARVAPLQAVMQQKPEWIENNFLNFIVQESLVKDPDVDAPLLSDLIEDPEGKAMMRLVDSGSFVGFSLATQSDVPADRVALLREAFDKMMSDPDFQATAQRTHSDLDYLSGVELTEFVREIVSTPEDIVTKLREVTGLNNN